MDTKSVAPTADPRARLRWADHLRTLCVVLVVNMHACVTFSHVGSWFVTAQPEPTLAQKIPFLYWQGHLQAFFMGLLFFLAGFMAHGSLRRKGSGAFLRERAVRLGLPTLLFMWVLHPLIVYGMNPRGRSVEARLEALRAHYLEGAFIGRSGPLWFAFALLLFCVVYALAAGGGRGARAAAGAADGHATRAGTHTPSVARLAAFGVLLVLTTFLVRIVQPIGTSVINFQFCYFPQYILAFAAGIAAARGGWLGALASSPAAARAGLAALVLGPLALTGLLAVFPIPEQGPPAFMGGVNAGSLWLSAWEQLSGLGLGLGLLALFARRLDVADRRLQWLSDRSFGVYVLHAPVLVALTPPIVALQTAPMAKAALLTVLGLAGSYLAADLARRVPGLRRIL